jgi:hypothetical protein
VCWEKKGNGEGEKGKNKDGVQSVQSGEMGNSFVRRQESLRC